MANNRSRSLLNLAHRINECTNCGAYSVEGCEPAHENGINAGKGFGIKGHDNRHAALCHSCHADYDQGPGSADDKAAMWNRAHKRTFDIYWRNGWLRVAA